MNTRLLPVLVVPHPQHDKERVTLAEQPVFVLEADTAHRQSDAVSTRGHLLSPHDHHPPIVVTTYVYDQRGQHKLTANFYFSNQGLCLFEETRRKGGGRGG